MMFDQSKKSDRDIRFAAILCRVNQTLRNFAADDAVLMAFPVTVG